VRSASVWKRLLGVEHTVVEEVVFDEDADAVVAMVRPTRSHRRRCAVCQRRCSGYDEAGRDIDRLEGLRRVHGCRCMCLRRIASGNARSGWEGMAVAPL
jgi:hypothetical protein